MAVTIKEIAACAGVSRGTVDRVLHNRPGVRPEVAAHVRRIADEMGFLPNRAGKILAARKQPLTVGCCFPGVGNHFFVDVADGYRAAQEEFAHYGVTVRLREVKGYNPAVHLAAIRALVAEGCGALCLSTVDTPEIRACVDDVIAQGIPVVTVNNDLTGTGRLCYVGTDYFRSGCVAAGLLCRMVQPPLELLVVTGSLYMKGHNERVRGFSQTLRDYGVPYRTVEVLESLDNEQHAYRTAKEVLSAHPETNCIYIAAAGAVGVGRAVRELGRQQDIVVCSCDDTEPIRRLVRQGVIDFTVCQEPWQQGYRAIQLLFDHFVDNRQTVPANHITGTVIKVKENID